MFKWKNSVETPLSTITIIQKDYKKVVFPDVVDLYQANHYLIIHQKISYYQFCYEIWDLYSIFKIERSFPR